MMTLTTWFSEFSLLYFLTGVSIAAYVMLFKEMLHLSKHKIDVERKQELFVSHMNELSRRIKELDRKILFMKQADQQTDRDQ